MTDYMVMEAVAIKVSQEDQEAAKRAERKQEQREKTRDLAKRLS